MQEFNAFGIGGGSNDAAKAQASNYLKGIEGDVATAGEAKALKRRLASFRDDNAEALSGDGVEIDGLNVRVKTTHELIVEAA